VAENNNNQKQQLKEITERLEQGVKDLFSSEKYMEYLRVMSQFHNYSFSNTLLIAMQKPDATLVAGYGAWQKKFERNVMKGQKAIKIFAPAPRKVEIERDMLDPDTRRPVIDENGEVQKETVTVQKPYFKITSVFDVSQTDGKPLPELDEVHDLTADVEGYAIFFEALKRTSKVPMDFEPIDGSSHGYYHQVEKRIVIAEGMSEAQNVKTGIHEIAHSRLHDRDMIDAENGIMVDQRTREVQAESVAYTVCQHYGIETSEYSFGYIAGWSAGMEMKELRSSMEVIRREADSMITEIDRHVEDIRREHEAEIGVPDKMPVLISEDKNPMESLNGHSRAAVEESVLSAAQAELDEAGLSDSVKILGVRVFGERTRDGLYEENTHISVVVSYSSPNGELYEDDFSDTLADHDMTLEGIPVDITPIRLDESGTLEDFIAKNEAYLDRMVLDKGVKQLLESSVNEEADLFEASKIAFPNMGGTTLYDNLYGAAVEKLRDGAETLDVVELFGKEALFTNGRVTKNALPEGLYTYDLRGSDNDPGQPVTLEPMVLVNHAASVIVPEKIEIPENGVVPLGDDMSFTGASITMEQFYDRVNPDKGAMVYHKDASDIAEKAVRFYLGNPDTMDHLGDKREKYLSDLTEKLSESYISVGNTVKAQIIPPMSKLTFTQAREQDKVDEWRASRKATESCAQEFNEKFGLAYHERRMPEFLTEMTDKYGMERCMIVLASTIQLADHDGRYYPSTKADAAKVDIPGKDTEDYLRDIRRSYCVNCHPVMVNSAFRVLQQMDREQKLDKASVAEQESKAPKASLLSRLQDKQREANNITKQNPTKTPDKKRGVEL